MKHLKVISPKGTEQIINFISSPHSSGKISISLNGKIIGKINRRSMVVIGDKDKLYALDKVNLHVKEILKNN